MKALSRVNVAPPLPLNVYARRPSDKLPFPLEDPRCRLFSLARHGLFAGIKALGLEPGDEILLPAYNHGSEVEALVQAGIVCRFYDAGPSLVPDEKELEALLSERTRALYIIHYLGLPQDAARWRGWCDERDLLLFEDAAQAWLSTRDGVPVGSHGDLSIFCLYKTFGLPDGGVVICNTPPEIPPGKRRLVIGRVMREHSLYLAQRSGWFAELHRRLKRKNREYDPERDFALGSPMSASLPTKDILLARVTSPQAQTARTANYAYLLERLERFVPEPFVHLHKGASPFAFPIQSRRKGVVRDRLRQFGVAAADFWSASHPILPKADFPRAAALRESVITLPVHQELRQRELERIVNAVLACVPLTRATPKGHGV